MRDGSGRERVVLVRRCRRCDRVVRACAACRRSGALHLRAVRARPGAGAAFRDDDTRRPLTRYSHADQEIRLTVRRARSSRALHAQAAELAWAVPQVVAHRLARIAAAGAKPTLRDRKELARMVNEKHAAFGESWRAMGLQALRSQQSLAVLARTALQPPSRRKTAASVFAMQLQLQQAALAVLGKGLSPVHRRAVANAKRLGKTKLR